jgi:polyisoprenoid-binding protein YceI
MTLVLAGCSVPVRQPATEPEKVGGAADLRGATLYTVAPTQSEVHIRVYRGGTLARLGHNHVMSAGALRGRVWMHPDFSRSGFELAFAVNELTVDDERARAAAGAEEFPPGIPDKDKEGTRRNMLREEVLDADHFSQITLRSARIEGTLAAPSLTVRITIKNVSRDVVVPTTLTLNGKQLRAQGEFEVRQTEFGIKPFSIAMGAMQVQDVLRIKFDIVAMQKM